MKCIGIATLAYRYIDIIETWGVFLIMESNRTKIVDRAFNGRWRVGDIRAMTKWENGKYKMTYKHLAEILNISVDRLRRILKRPDEDIVDIPRGDVIDQFTMAIGFQSPAIDQARRRIVLPPEQKSAWGGDIIARIKALRARR